MSEEHDEQHQDGESFDNTEALDALQAEAEQEEGRTAEGEYIPGEGEGQGGPEMSTAEVCAFAARATFAVIASRRGDHWEISQGEADQLGEAYGALMDKYFPEAQAGPELTAVVVTAMVVMPRAMQDKGGGAE